jgi:cytochrome c-type biogenesis protein CcmH
VSVLKRWPGWLLMAVVLAAFLAIGATRAGGARSNAERVDAIAKTIKCPVCRSESVFDSKAQASQNIRDEIARQVAAGRTDGEIRAYVNDRFKDQGLLLVPPKTGIDSLVWVLPVVAVVLAAGGLAVAFHRWRTMPDLALTDEDRSIVERYRHEHQDG